ncbi:hypothetical protein [Mycolicibacterium celeriflavum]|uniref:Uncharacterized protein n=1 Tax=Mycolicibacterium celeriflavum TaxID=1249101 RepID=A0A1X0BU92_MYCCF|nr:hypothetical protein [Mycolicibacterium celeriflavum]MCV7239886.1 hypothetical protein [Mycolicibacterium celeriflavum]ORA47217.1 hypothetical protein BST21_13245 [Mycolicibacterium celeriflavum]BBY44270.1 hypothetical protein MCEL_25650 [Mycolicibacterium celeriflavum]
MPVHAGISEAHCRAVAAAAAPPRGPDWFTELLAEPTPQPDDATLRYNAAISSIRSRRRPLDKRSAEHIQATFGSHDTDELIGALT